MMSEDIILGTSFPWKQSSALGITPDNLLNTACSLESLATRSSWKLLRNIVNVRCQPARLSTPAVKFGPIIGVFQLFHLELSFFMAFSAFLFYVASREPFRVPILLRCRPTKNSAELDQLIGRRPPVKRRWTELSRLPAKRGFFR